MSAVETKEPVKLTKKYDIFDENLNEVSKEVTVEYTEVTTQEDALAVLNRIGDYIGAANTLLRREALSNARKEAGVSGGINRAVVMEFIKPYRELPQFASMIKSPDKRKATAEEWNAQTRAILDQIKNVPFIMASIRERSASAGDDE